MFVAPADPLALPAAPAGGKTREREPLSTARATRRAELIANLADPVMVSETAETLEYWQLGTFNAFKPRNAWEDWLGQQVSEPMFRISRAERIERRLRDLQSLRAIDFWEEDQRLRAEEVAAQLVAEPGPTFARLVGTPAGCDWLIERWEGLRDIPVEQWTEAQKVWARLVCPVKPSELARPGFVAEQVAGLFEQRERNRDADRALRALVEADLGDEVSPALARLRRYRSSLVRQMKWYVAQLRVAPPEHRVDHRYHPDHDRVLLEPRVPADPITPAAPAPTPDRVAARRNNETNPLAVPAAAENTQTKPPGPNSPAAEQPQTESNQTVVAIPPLAPADQVEHRKRRVDPARELARHRKATRRRSA